MKAIKRTPLSEVRAKEEELKAKDAQLQSLGFSLVQEKLKHAQTIELVNTLGQELTKTKLDIAALKGGKA